MLPGIFDRPLVHTYKDFPTDYFTDKLLLWLCTLKISAQWMPTNTGKKMFKLIISKLFYLIWHSDFKIIGLRMVLNIISSYCQQVTRNNWFHCYDHVYTRSFLPKYRMKLLFDNSESSICAGHSILLCTYSS